MFQFYVRSYASIVRDFLHAFAPNAQISAHFATIARPSRKSAFNMSAKDFSNDVFCLIICFLVLVPLTSLQISVDNNARAYLANHAMKHTKTCLAILCQIDHGARHALHGNLFEGSRILQTKAQGEQANGELRAKRRITQ